MSASGSYKGFHASGSVEGQGCKDEAAKEFRKSLDSFSQEYELREEVGGSTVDGEFRSSGQEAVFLKEKDK